MTDGLSFKMLIAEKAGLPDFWIRGHLEPFGDREGWQVFNYGRRAIFEGCPFGLAMATLVTHPKKGLQGGYFKIICFSRSAFTATAHRWCSTTGQFAISSKASLISTSPY